MERFRALQKTFMILFLTVSFAPAALALEGCPTDPKGLADFVSGHFKWQRQSSVVAHVVYHDVKANATAAFERTSQDGLVTLANLNAPGSRLTLPMRIVIHLDQDATKAKRQETELNEDNYRFYFAGQEDGLYKYAVTPVAPLKGRIKSGFVWLDPKTCSISKAKVAIDTESSVVPSVMITASYETVNGVYVVKSSDFKYKTRIFGYGGEVSAASSIQPADVVPPSTPAPVVAFKTGPPGRRSSGGGQTH